MYLFSTLKQNGPLNENKNIEICIHVIRNDMKEVLNIAFHVKACPTTE